MGDISASSICVDCTVLLLLLRGGLPDSHTHAHIPPLILLTKCHKIFGGRQNTDVAFNDCNVGPK